MSGARMAARAYRGFQQQYGWVDTNAYKGGLPIYYLNQRVNALQGNISTINSLKNTVTSLQTKLPSIQIPPNSNTLKINDSILFENNTGNTTTVGLDNNGNLEIDASNKNIIVKNRIYQELNSGTSWEDVNGYYGLAKDAYPALDPYSFGLKAVSTWVSRNPAADETWQSVCWSPELKIFVAINNANNNIMTSSDGINWTLQATVGNSWDTICWSPELNLFVALSTSGSVNQRVMTSNNGTSWTLRTSPSFDAGSSSFRDWRGICWSKELGIFVAVSSTGGNNRSMTSPDGINWTLGNATLSYDSICWSPELKLFVATSNSNSGSYSTSVDGINWVVRTCPSYTWLNICWSSTLGIFVSLSYGGGKIMVSSDGINWILIDAPGGANTEWRSVCWSPQLGLFVAVAGFGTNRVITSPDGFNWTLANAASNNIWSSICWSPELGIFVAVSKSGFANRVMTSSLLARPPTSYNVFDSNFNNIDQNGNWTIQQVTKSGTYPSGQTTPSIAGINLFYLSNGSVTTITNLLNGVANQKVILVFNDSNTTIQANSNIKLSGGVNFTSTQYDTLTLLYTGTLWVEICRSINS